jgi:hypothetical protein
MNLGTMPFDVYLKTFYASVNDSSTFMTHAYFKIAIWHQDPHPEKKPVAPLSCNWLLCPGPSATPAISQKYRTA